MYKVNSTDICDYFFKRISCIYTHASAILLYFFLQNRLSFCQPAQNLFSRPAPNSLMFWGSGLWVGHSTTFPGYLWMILNQNYTVCIMFVSKTTRLRCLDVTVIWDTADVVRSLINRIIICGVFSPVISYFKKKLRKQASPENRSYDKKRWYTFSV